MGRESYKHTSMGQNWKPRNSTHTCLRWWWQVCWRNSMAGKSPVKQVTSQLCCWRAGVLVFWVRCVRLRNCRRWSKEPQSRKAKKEWFLSTAKMHLETGRRQRAQARPTASHCGNLLTRRYRTEALFLWPLPKWFGEWLPGWGKIMDMYF
jgi:hypothetical protein